MLLSEMEFLRKIEAFARKYKREWSEPVALNILNRRFGVEFKKAFGYRVSEAIRAEDGGLFRLRLGRKGATTVDVLDDTPLEALIKQHLRDGPLSRAELTARLKGCGHKMTEFIDTVSAMELSGVLHRSAEDVFRLLTVSKG